MNRKTFSQISLKIKSEKDTDTFRSKIDLFCKIQNISINFEFKKNLKKCFVRKNILTIEFNFQVSIF